MCKIPMKRYNENGERIYSEFTDSDQAIQLYNRLPVKNGKRPIPIFIVLGLDKTPLSSTGFF